MDATKVEFAAFTVLLGRNNEGKSNFLRALAIAFAVLREESLRLSSGGYVRPALRTREYDWERDYPIAYRARERGRRDTTIRLSFELNTEELEAFYQQFDSRLTTALTLEIALPESGQARIRWAKQGKSAGKFERRLPELAEFILSRFVFLYVPAIRTELESTRIVADLINRQIFQASRGEEYRAAMEAMKAIEQPMFDKLGDDIVGTIRSFLPNVGSIRLGRSDRDTPTRIMPRNIQIFVDDGHETDIAYKGDGIKSIVALAMFKHGVPEGQSSLLAIEEPEAHLHAGAIHELRDVLAEISKKSQVVISTHSHAFVSRERPKNNLIVHDGEVRQARSISEIRRIIGVRASDNLISTDFIIVVEGTTDESILGHILRKRSSAFETALKAGTVAFDVLGGASKLAHKAGSLRREVFAFLVLFDNDLPGRTAVASAISAQCMDNSDYKLLTVPGLAESELEDLIDPSVYLHKVSAEYGVTFRRNSIPGRAKWSERMRAAFVAQGKLWDDATKENLKRIVTEEVIGSSDDVLQEGRAEVIDSIVEAVEARLTKLSD